MELLTSQQVADLLGFKVATIRRYTRDRKIDALVVGGTRRYTREAVDKFLTEHTLSAKDSEQYIKAKENDNA